jgi:trehalose 6-phosphate phosphatase
LKPGSSAELTEWALGAEHLWLFLDYDGTLAEFAPTPEHLEPNPAIIRLLEQLARRPGIRLTILSGRRLAHIRQLLPVAGIILAGTYGIELLAESGETINLIQHRDIRPILESIKPHWLQLIAGRNGFFLEDKDWALALHARFADDEEAARVLGQALEAATLRLPPEHVRILGGHKFLEVAPRLASKSQAVAYLLNEYALPEARLVYVGDDDKDEEAFPVIHARDGVAVKVQQASQISQPTTADFFFHSPQETLAWLAELLAAN